MRIVVTAGPTREYLDDVRFITNASSGRMGYAIARAAARAGHEVDLVSGPTMLEPPRSVRVTHVMTTQEMYEATARLFERADCLIGAAAPADYRPARRARGKPRKPTGPFALRLRPTVDILGVLGRRKGRRVIVAFALEVQDPVRRAVEKMRQKRADAVVLNGPSAMGADRADATVIARDGVRIEMRNASKEQIAARIVRLAEELWAGFRTAKVQDDSEDHHRGRQQGRGR